MAKEVTKVEVITAVYKAYLHCPKCAQDIQKPLLRIPGVQNVDVKFDKGEITVKGSGIDAKKIHGRLQKWSKKKVELVSETKSSTEVKKETIKTFTMKVYLHCDQCEKEAHRRLLMHKGIHNVKSDIKAQTITVEGAIESEKLITYMRKKVHKYAEIIPPKEKKVEKEEKKETVKIEVKSGDKVEEFKEVKKVEVKTKEGGPPYFIHYVYAPQLFSDENPNACCIL